MGFDIVGNSKTEAGEYFRNNVWWWRPLWNFVCQACEDILTKDEIEGGEYNSGTKISKAKADKIANKLAELIAEGEVLKYEEEYMASIKKLRKSEVCDLCDGTGKRNDEHVKGECNGCEGDGKTDPWQCNYPFREENVVEFMNFCGESQGFQIW